MTKPQADLWIVAGPPGSGKTTVADVLLELLDPTPALLDKDTIYNSFDEALLKDAGRPLGEREGEWYDAHLKVHEYAGLTAAAREVRSRGCPVLLSGPFTKQIHDVGLWSKWVDQLGGGKVHLVWVHTDAETLRSRLESRGSDRDTEKLAKFDEFISYMQPETPPPIAHFPIDNRMSATSVTLESQLRIILADLA